MPIHQDLVESNRRRRPRHDSLFAIEPTAEPGVVVKMSSNEEEALHRSRYVVLNQDGGWQIRTAHRHVASTFPSKQQALSAAIDLAEEDGHAAEVMVRHEDDRFIKEWTHGEDLHPDDAARPAGEKQPGRSGA
jgi:hypothetical protein